MDLTLPPPDLETSSIRYARRFSGETGAYLLRIQDEGVRRLIVDAGTGFASALDIGGGHGQLIDALLTDNRAVTVVGSTDACAERLRCSAQAGRVTFATADLLNLPYADRSFDLVTSIRLLAHIADPDRLIAELCRVANKSVIVDYPSWIGPNALALAAFPIKRLIEKDTRTYRTFWPGHLIRTFRAHGFRPARPIRQFAAPMGLHRLAGSPVRHLEEGLRRLGITGLIGNPVLHRFDREDMP